MELHCPNCQQKLNIPDQFAGQMMRCPLCNGTFTAPGLAPSAPPSSPSPPPVMGGASPFNLAPEPSASSAAPPPPPASYAPAPSSYAPPPSSYVPEPPPAPRRQETPLPPPRDYIPCCVVFFSLRAMPWITAGALTVVFLISFFPWLPSWVGLELTRGQLTGGHNAWTWGFDRHGNGLLIAFDIFMVIAFAASIPSALAAMGVIPLPANLRVFRPVVVGAIAFLTFVFLSIPYLQWVFNSGPATLWFKLAYRLMFLAVVSSGMEIWLELRRAKNLPPPKLEFYR